MFIFVINETVAVLKSESFKRQWVVFPVLRMDEFENTFPLLVILVNLFESCFEIVCHFYENDIVSGEKLVFNDGENMVNVENIFCDRRRRQWCFFGQTKQNVGYFPACVLYLIRIEKVNGNTNETEVEFICIARNQFRLFYDNGCYRMVNVNYHLKSIPRCIKHVFNFSNYPYQPSCFELRKPVFSFCVCQKSV